MNKERDIFDKKKLKQIQIIELRILKIVDKIFRKHNIEYWLDWGNLIGVIRHKGFIPWDDDIDLGIRNEDYKKAMRILEKELPEDIFLQTHETDEEYNNYEGVKLRDVHSNLSGGKSKKNGIFIEIFPMYKVPNNKFLQKLQISLYRNLISSRIDKSNRLKIKLRRALSKFVTLFYEYDLLEKKILNMYKITKNYLYRHALHSTARAVDYYFPEEVLFPLKEMKYEDGIFKVPNNTPEYLRIAFGDYMTLPPEKDRVPGHMDVDKVVINNKEL